MPRPRKQRRLLHNTPTLTYKPTGIPLADLRVIRLLSEEMEALRLADLEDLSQVDAASQMGVSRSTFQRVLSNARRLVTMALVEGQALQVVGDSTQPVPSPRNRPAKNQAL